MGCGTARRWSSNRSRKPADTSSPTREPLRSISALVATVLLWVWTIRCHAGPSSCRVAWISSTPFRMPAPGREGMLGTLKQCSSPDSVTNARSVKVPPTSVPSMLDNPLMAKAFAKSGRLPTLLQAAGAFGQPVSALSSADRHTPDLPAQMVSSPSLYALYQAPKIRTSGPCHGRV